jgi:hypothetical protein
VTFELVALDAKDIEMNDRKSQKSKVLSRLYFLRVHAKDWRKMNRSDLTA